MTAQSSQPKLFDKRFVLSLALIVFCWMGWQSYLAKKYPEAYKPKDATLATTESKAKTSGDTQLSAANTTAAQAPEVTQKMAEQKETLVPFENDIWSFQISSEGMALKNVILKHHTQRSGDKVSFAVEEDTSLFATGVTGQRQPLTFSITKSSENEFVGVSSYNGMKVTKVLQINSENHTIRTRIQAENIPATVAGFYTEFREKIKKHVSSGFFARDPEHQEFFVDHDGGKHTRTLVNVDSTQSANYNQAKVASFGSQYFAVAVIDNKSTIIPEFKEATVATPEHFGIGILNYSLLNKATSMVLDYTTFAGPKSYTLLKSVDADLAGLVDFGFFNAIAKILFWLMRALETSLGNWGLAIIFLTIIVRIIVLPLNLVGYKQMKAMTKIQPEMKAIREKYKNDPQRMNQETLSLMKDAKANPLGGCLPMLVQIPVFFALYQVIGQSIELYQAPFMLWIDDLSYKDPFFVLPILMGVTMYIQQKITPTAMDPAQQKIMMFMPIMFAFFMISLPSGLTLYIFISSVFAVLQQLYFMKEKKVATA